MRATSSNQSVGYFSPALNFPADLELPHRLLQRLNVLLQFTVQQAGFQNVADTGADFEQIKWLADDILRSGVERA